MKSYLKYVTLALIFAALMLSACSVRPQAVSRDQYYTALDEAVEAETTANNNLQRKNDLEAELARKEAELRSLIDYERELGL